MVRSTGLVIHIGRATSRGFEAIEVWESREHFERYAREVVDPVTAEVSQGKASPVGQGAVEFDLRGPVVPGAEIFH
jgi:hypothetical protein